MSDELYQRLLDSSFRLVSFRPRSEKEIRTFLSRKLQKIKNADKAILDLVITRLTELGYVNDTKFVQWWVKARQGSKPKGLQLIIGELLSKGIAREIIEHILPSEITDEKELAVRAVQKKLANWYKLPPLAQKKKIADFLLRRGFSSGIVYAVVDDIVGKHYNTNR